MISMLATQVMVDMIMDLMKITREAATILRLELEDTRTLNTIDMDPAVN